MVISKSRDGIKLAFDWIIKFRFIIAIVFVAIFVVFKLNMSSIGMWNDQLTNDSKQTDSSVVLGTPKAIRSDEWRVQTPFYIAQSANGFKLTNKNISTNGQNMILSYNAPVAALSVLGKPFNWGMFFLGRDRGLSWYWAVKLAGIILLAFEFCLILTKKKYLSLLGSVWLAFSPAVQWWFMQQLGDLMFFSLAMLVSIYHLFWKEHPGWSKSLLALFFTSSSIGFALVFYPALQVPFAYFMLAMIIGLLIAERENFHVNKLNLSLVVGSFIIIGFVLGQFYRVSGTDVTALLNTIYPGKQISLGGSGNNLAESFGSMFNYLINWKLPYGPVSFANQAEASSFFNLLPLVLLFIPEFVKHARKNAVALAVLIQTVGLIIWYFVEFPRWFAKASLMSHVTSSRALPMIGFSAMILTIWFIGWAWDYYAEKPIKLSVLLSVTGIVFMVYAWSMILGEMQTATRGWTTILTMVVVVVLVLSLLVRKRILFGTIVALLVGFSGVPVNTITVGTSAIFNKKIVKTIKKIDNKNSNLTWLSGSTTSNLLPMLNIKSIGNTNFEPDLKMWYKIDPGHKHEKTYNRYANVVITLVPQNSKTTFNNPSDDSVAVNMRPSDLKKLNVKRVVTTQDLRTLSTKKIKFKRLASVHQNQVFSVSYK